MYDTSVKWKENIYKNPTFAMNIYIDDELLNPKYLIDFKPGCELFNKDFELGSTPCRYIEMEIHKLSGITKPQKVRIECGILINHAITVAELNKMLVCEVNKLKVKSLSKNDSSFEMIPFGIYNVDDFIENDGNTFTIKVLDNVINFNKDNGYYDASELINEKGYATMGEIAQDICSKKGVELRFYFFFELRQENICI